ncbi:biotin-dependent carboxyltransferase family protein [Bowmanella denitrificans]|uniref:5-oxoprolinase subunit C family protein n=1 Tax=Bowmanella denitrificans TaxID=366582 RepID=UPI000C9BEDCB|nr:biotin-dependent carboxyltransferase family protein [Bowmanella denitrificans]
MFTVLKAGLMTLLTDAGRFGQAKLGLTQGGPMDPFAFELANYLVGNQSDSTALEMTLGGLHLKTDLTTWVCVSGAPLNWRIDDVQQPMWQSVQVRAGQTIELDVPETGLRSYLAVAGGFAIAPSFGSTTTVLREGIGGLDGNKLKVDDQLCVGPMHATLRKQALPETAIPQYQQELVLRLIPAYQYQEFSAASRALFFTSTYEVSHQADRMGYRLQGQKVPSQTTNMLSEGIALGAVQIPADGQPIVLLNDRQTIGGYPKIGSVLSLDCAKLAQCRPGGKISFEPISMEQAHNLMLLSRSRKQNLLARLDSIHG